MKLSDELVPSGGTKLPSFYHFHILSISSFYHNHFVIKKKYYKVSLFVIYNYIHQTPLIGLFNLVLWR